MKKGLFTAVVAALAITLCTPLAVNAENTSPSGTIVPTDVAEAEGVKKGMTVKEAEKALVTELEVGEDYSIQEGSDEDFDYYGKVLEDDTTRLVTVLLRYKPEHSEAVEPMREWVRNFKLK